jgi:hypothetical protein
VRKSSVALEPVNRKDAAGEGIDEKYTVDAQEVAVYGDSKAKATGQLPSLIGVVALGAVPLVVVVSGAEATLRPERSAGGRPARLADENQFESVPPNRTANEGDINLENWLELSPDSGPYGGISISFQILTAAASRGVAARETPRRESEHRARE